MEKLIQWWMNAIFYIKAISRLIPSDLGNNKEPYKPLHIYSAEELVSHVKQFFSSRNYNTDIVDLII